jgi:hypothetical protein
MDLNGLPADIAQFVGDALASGKYPSAEALGCKALQVLQQQDEDPKGGPGAGATHRPRGALVCGITRSGQSQ